MHNERAFYDHNGDADAQDAQVAGASCNRVYRSGPRASPHCGKGRQCIDLEALKTLWGERPRTHSRECFVQFVWRTTRDNSERCGSKLFLFRCGRADGGEFFALKAIAR